MSKVTLNSTQKRAIKAYVQSSTFELSEEEKLESIGLSVDGFSFQLNSALRANLTLTPKVDAFLSSLDSAFEGPVTSKELIVHRAANYLEMLRYLSNSNYVDFGYMSTSKDHEPTHRFYQRVSLGYFPAYLRITIPPNSNVLDLDNIPGVESNTYEGEILFRRRSNFKVKSNSEISSLNFIKEIGCLTHKEFETIRFIELEFLNYLSL